MCRGLFFYPVQVFSAAAQVIIQHGALADDGQGRGVLLGIVRHGKGLRGHGAGGVFLVDRQLTVGLHHRKVDLLHPKNTVLAQLAHQVVGGKTQLLHFLLVYFPVLNDNDGLSGNDPPQFFVFHTKIGGHHLKAHQRQNGQQTGKHGAVALFNGQRGDIGNQDGDDQLRGLQLSDLALTHQTDPEHDDKV